MSLVRPVGHEERLSLIEHLDELRSRLIFSIAVFMVAFSFCYWQNGWLLHTVNRPLQQTQNLDGKKRSKDPLEESARYQLRSGEAQRATAQALQAVDRLLGSVAQGGGMTAAQRTQLQASRQALQAAAKATATAAEAVPTNTARQPITLGVTEPFLTTFTVAAYAALLLSMPFLLYQAYAFVLPAFSDEERRVALPLMLMVPFLFVAGVAFGYFVALPRAINFLQNFNDDSFDILIRASDYYRFSVLLLGVIGLLFQIPVGVLAVTRLGIISAGQLAKNRGYVILGLSVVAAVATPTPDPVTMIVAMAPLVVLFELSVQLAKIFERRRAARSEEDDDDDWDEHDKPALS
ncbi:MAG: sec-independent protein translocase protein TatC [Solirubrobacteraceae bacterium]|jgi:sec-independent protein translocase protein TatC|nr:sec-independent protein translocase protein TatC [Solirubrobacteraceae bacterium]